MCGSGIERYCGIVLYCVAQVLREWLLSVCCHGRLYMASADSTPAPDTTCTVGGHKSNTLNPYQKSESKDMPQGNVMFKLKLSLFW